VRYYLAHDSLGPTKGVWWQHVAPSNAFDVFSIDPTPKLAIPAAASDRGGSWELVRTAQPALSGTNSDTFWKSERDTELRDRKYLSLPLLQRLQAWQLALPVDNPAPICHAWPSLRTGPQPHCRHAGTSMLGAAGEAAIIEAPLALSAEHLEGLALDAHGREVANGTPVAALRVSDAALAVSSPLRTIRASEEALVWLRSHTERFPRLHNGS
jgi:hypothetical protein